MMKLEEDTALSASLATAGFGRTTLYDDDFDFGGRSRLNSGGLEMAQRRSDVGSSFDPFVGYAIGSQDRHGGMREEGYIPAIPSSLTLPYMGMGEYLGIYDDNEESRRHRKVSGGGHTSAGSYEPLLAAFAKASESPSPELGSDRQPPTPPPRNPLRVFHKSQPGSPRIPVAVLNKSLPGIPPTRRASSVYTSESAEPDDRLNPGLIWASTTDLRDDKDYSRPVLGVRNVIDASSVFSTS